METLPDNTDKKMEYYSSAKASSNEDKTFDFETLPKAKPSIKNLIILGSAELLGTALLVFLNCMGNTAGMQGAISTLHSSLNGGLAVMAVIQIFGHISGAYVNPAVTMAAFIFNEVTLIQVLVYLIAQISGSLVGYGALVMVTPKIFTGIELGNNTNAVGNCVFKPHQFMTDWEAFAVEVILTLILLLSICSSWDSKNRDKQDSIPLRIGFVVGMLTMSAGPYTRASMNPAMSFAPAVWNNMFTSHWVYWAGPTVGSLLASSLYKFVYQNVK